MHGLICSSLPSSDGNIENFFVLIFIDIVTLCFYYKNEEGKLIKSYKSQTMTDRVIDQNYHNYE